MARPRSVTNEDVLRTIRAWIAEHGLPPTVEELRNKLGVGSTRTVLRYLQTLEASDEIERWPGSRGLRVRKGPDQRTTTVAVPIVGTAPAGALMLAEQNIDGWIRLPAEFLRPAGREHFLLRVRGNSMNRCEVAGGLIENGDLVLVRRQGEAQTGNVIVALIDGAATIKKLALAPGYAVLRPLSSETSHQTVVVKEGFRVQGVVRRVLKRGSELLARILEEGA